MTFSQSCSHARTAENRADDGGHERLVGKQVQAGHLVADECQRNRQHGHGVDGFHAEPPTQRHQRENEQNGVDDKIAHLSRNRQRTPLQNRGNTSHTTRGEGVGQEEGRPSDTIGKHGDGNHRVVAHFAPDFCFQSTCHNHVV